MVGDELTTADSWEHLWKGAQSRQVGLRWKLRTQTAWLRLLRGFLDIHAGSADVLELGCAPGAMIEQLYSLRPDHSYRGIDIAEVGLKIARQRLATQGIEADLRLGDIRTATVASADLVMSFGLAEHLSDPTEALR
jgi:cyclopropane fatty-acyl-phospholipid synthase-like methyltransferase